MTILFMGGDLSSMTDTGFGEDFASVAGEGAIPFTALGVRSDGSISEYVKTPSWTAVQDIWLHGVMRPNTGNSEPIYFMDGSTVVAKLDYVGYTAPNYVFRMMYLSALDTFTQVGTDFTIPFGTGWFYIDIHLKTGASGACAVFVNGAERMPEAAASMTYAPDITSIWYNGHERNDHGGIIAADESTIGWRLGRLVPLANGADTAFTGDVTNVDETVNSDADYIYSSTANDVETYTVSTVPASFTGYVPRAVAVSARAKRGSTGPQNLQLVLRSGGTNYFSSTKALGLGFTGQEGIWETNPDTGLAWTTSQLTGLQIGVKAIT